MVTGVTVNGIKRIIEGGYTEYDYRASVAVAPQTSGVPALVGTAESGEPLAVYRFANYEQVAAVFRSGDLLLAARMVFDAMRDDVETGTPSELVCVKVNNDTQSDITLNSAAGAAMTLTSEGYGSFANRISVSVADGTNQGILLTLTLDDVIETVDDLGGDPVFSLSYVGSAATMRATLSASELYAQYTATAGGEDDEITTFDAGDVAHVVSDDAWDNFQTYTVYGVRSGAAVSESGTLNGTTPVLGTQVFDTITGVAVNGVLAGDVVFTDQNGTPNEFATLAATLDATPTAGILTIVSNNSADVGDDVNGIRLGVQISGQDASGVRIGEFLALNGTTTATSVNSYTKIFSFELRGAAAGTITIKDSTTTTIETLTAAAPTDGIGVNAGLWYPTDMSFDGLVTLVSSGASTKVVVIRGRSKTTGAYVREIVTLTGTTPVNTTNQYSSIQQIELGDVENAQTITFSGRAFSAAFSAFDTFTKLSEYVNNLPGWTLTLLADDIDARTPADSDYFSSQDVKSVTLSVLADLYEQMTWINTYSALVTATRESGGTGSLVSTGGALNLSGGTDATANAADYEAGLAKLRTAEVDLVCALSDSATVRALVDTHCRYMNGAQGRYECFGFVGLGTGRTLAQVKTDVAALNTANLSAYFQEIQRLDPVTAVKTWYAPKFLAALSMGATASMRTGKPLLRKVANVLATREHTSIDLHRDAETLLKAGVVRLTPYQGRIVWGRGITTYTRQEDETRNESSAMQALLQSSRIVRQGLEADFVGKDDSESNLGLVKRRAETWLESVTTARMLRAYRNIVVTEVGTALEVAYEAAPVKPRNFVLTKVLVLPTAALAA